VLQGRCGTKDSSYKGRIVQGAHRTRDTSYKGCMEQVTPHPGDVSSSDASSRDATSEAGFLVWIGYVSVPFRIKGMTLEKKCPERSHTLVRNNVVLNKTVHSSSLRLYSSSSSCFKDIFSQVSYPFSERAHTSKQVRTLSKLKIPPQGTSYETCKMGCFVSYKK
jgi:hypothetical protein